MNQNKQHIFVPLHTDFICQYKEGGLVPGPHPPLHCHDGYEILIFLGQDSLYYTENEGKLLQRGDIIFCAPYTFHCAAPQNEKDYIRVLINISEPLLQSLGEPGTNLSGMFYRNSPGNLNLISVEESQLQDFCSLAIRIETELKQAQYGSTLLIRALLTQLLVLLNRHAPEPASSTFTSVMPPLVAEIFAYIEQHLTEDLSLNILASSLYHNGDYLSRCFKAVTGTSIQQFILAKRVTLAQKLLREGVTPCDACYLSGFHNYSNFSRAFSKQIGMSPKQYQLQSQT